MADLDLLAPGIDDYLHRLQPPPDKVLAQMQAMGEERGFPIIGPLVGRACEQLARSIQARTVFELGSGFGYSTLWFARAVGPGGHVVHTEFDANKSQEARDWMTKAKVADRVDFRVGDAVQLARADKGPYDVVFIDIDKHGYPDAWAQAKRLVRVGGLVLTDNTLWHGKVAGKARDADTMGVRTYNDLAFGDAAFLSTLMPIRDGLAVSLRLR